MEKTELLTYEKALSKNFENPDEVLGMPFGKMESINLGGVKIGRATFQPGWRWTTSLKSIFKTDSCEAQHFMYHVSGTLKLLMNDGTELILKPGDISLTPSGHDSWVIGDEPVVLIEFQALIDHSKSVMDLYKK